MDIIRNVNYLGKEHESHFERVNMNAIKQHETACYSNLYILKDQ